MCYHAGDGNRGGHLIHTYIYTYIYICIDIFFFVINCSTMFRPFVDPICFVFHKPNFNFLEIPDTLFSPLFDIHHINS